jgi:hypothetical protein
VMRGKLTFLSRVALSDEYGQAAGQSPRSRLQPRQEPGTADRCVTRSYVSSKPGRTRPASPARKITV